MDGSAGMDAPDREEVPDEGGYRLPMVYKIGLVCCLYLCSITTFLVVSGPAAFQVFSTMVAAVGNETSDQVNETNEGFTELRLLECSDKLEIDQTMEVSFEIENHLGSSHNYSYAVTGQSGGIVENLQIGWIVIEDGDVLRVATSAADFPPPGSLGKVTITLDTGEKADFLVNRYQAFYFVIKPTPGKLHELWEISCGTELDDRLSRVCKGLNGMYVFAGNAQEIDKSQSPVDSDILLVEVDEEGNEGWRQIYVRGDIQSAYDMVVREDGSCVVAGRTFKSGDRQQVYVLKVDALGQKVWERAWGENESSIARCIAPASDGFIVAGYTGPWVSSKEDLYVAKLDQDGDLVWETTYGGDLHDSAHRIIPCTGGGYLMAGYSDCPGSSTTGYLRLIYLVRINEDGDLIWETTHGKGSWNEPHEIIQTQDGGFLIVGKSSMSGATSDAYVLRVDKNGQKVWERFYTGRDNSCFVNGFRTSRGDYILGGYSYVTRDGAGEAFFIRIDDGGQTIWQTVLEGVGFAAMGSTSDGDILLTRTVETVGSGTDAAISRYEVT